MVNSESKWPNVINRVFSPRPSRDEASTSPHTTPGKPSRLQRSKSFLVRSLQKLKVKTSSMDDDASFLSPMPPSLRTPSPVGSYFSELGQWDPSNERDPFRRSSMKPGGTSDSFPRPTIHLRSQTLPTGSHTLGPISSSPLLSQSHSQETISKPDLQKGRVLNRSPTPPPYFIRRCPAQYSATSISSNRLSRTHQLAGRNSARKSPHLDQNLSCSSSESLASHQSSPSPSFTRSRSYSPLSRAQTPHPKSPSSSRLSTSISLHNIKFKSTKQHFINPLPPSSPSLFINYQPGLEYRVIRGSTHSRSGSHVPVRTSEF